MHRRRVPPTLLAVTLTLLRLAIELALLSPPTAAGKVRDETPFGYHAPYAPEPQTIDAGFRSCRPDLVFAYIRHGSRLPTPGHKAAITKALAKIQNYLKQNRGHTLPAQFAHLDSYRYRFPGTQNLNRRGCNEMDAAGLHFAQRYAALETPVKLQLRTLPRERCPESAQCFRDGFVKAAGKRRPMIRREREVAKVKDRVEEAEVYKDQLLPPIVRRVNDLLGFHQHEVLDKADVLALMNLCAHEVVEASSPEAQQLPDPGVCDLFTPSDWDGYERVHSIERYHRNLTPKLSLPGVADAYARELAQKLRQKPSKPPVLRANFGSQTWLINIQGRLGLLGDLVPPRLVPEGGAGEFAARRWLRFGARVYVERLRCTGSSEMYVRVLLNDAVLPLPCREGDEWGRCKLETFLEMVNPPRQSGPQKLVGKWEKFVGKWKGH